MLDLFFNAPFAFFSFVFSLLVAITLHEFSHAFIADKLGDPTPRLAGRLTLNPLAHLDPWGTLALFIAKVGWGKPVPIDTFNLRHPRKDTALISLAGPLSNLILAFFISLFLKISFIKQNVFLFTFFYPLIILNAGLGVFNLLPLGPLDGTKIITGLLPYEQAYKFEKWMNQYGLILLLFFLLPLFNGYSLITLFLNPLLNFIFQLLI